MSNLVLRPWQQYFPVDDPHNSLTIQELWTILPKDAMLLFPVIYRISDKQALEDKSRELEDKSRKLGSQPVKLTFDQ